MSTKTKVMKESPAAKAKTIGKPYSFAMNPAVGRSGMLINGTKITSKELMSILCLLPPNEK